MSVVTFKEFEEFIFLPENDELIFEWIDGEIVEVPRRGTWYSQLALLVGTAVYGYCQNHQLPSHISGAGGAYRMLENILVPQFAYKLTPMSNDYPDPNPPLWVAEVITPNDLAVIIRKKRQIYMSAGILLWEMYPKSESIDVYAPGKSVQTFDIDGTLDVSNVLPGFTFAVRDLFAE
ncbi:MAG: Uma2 family endonuclease [Chloroflexota bacterium]